MFQGLGLARPLLKMAETQKKQKKITPISTKTNNGSFLDV